MPDHFFSTYHKEAETRSTKLLKNTLQTIQDYQLLAPGEAVVAAVSGGPDSVCLLDQLFKLSLELDLTVGVAHLNHGLRASDADRDADFVRDLAGSYRLRFYHKKADVRDAAKKEGMSLEEAGRIQRYAFFNEVAKTHGYDKIALGHSFDDNAELFLMNLLRGSGPSGLKGMAPIRGSIIRPLIQTSRDTILAYLTENALSYRNDTSNTDPVFLRNRIRHELLPLLEKEYNPAIRANLNRMANIFSTEQAWLEALEDQALARVVRSLGPNESELCLSGLKNLHTAQLRRVLRRVIEKIKGDMRGIGFSHLDAAVRLVHSPRPTAWIDLPARIRLEKSGPCLRVRHEPENLRKCPPRENRPVFQYAIQLGDLPVSLWIPEIQRTLHLRRVCGNLSVSGAGMPAPGSDPLSDRTPEARDKPPEAEDKMTAYMDLDRIDSPLTVRSPEPGDRIKPLGMKGSQKIKDVFINNKVPQSQRPYFPVLSSRDTIIWLAGRVLSEQVKVTPGTRHMLKAELTPGKKFQPTEIKTFF